jgi:hypothetical protein
MRVLALVALLGCDKGEPPRAKPVPAPAPVPAMGTIKGRTTFTLRGGGAMRKERRVTARHGRDEKLGEDENEASGPDRTAVGASCTIALRAAGGEQLTATSDEGGLYEIRVPVGRYTVSFDACNSGYCEDAADQRTQTVEVGANATVDVSWDCPYSAK